MFVTVKYGGLNTLISGRRKNGESKLSISSFTQPYSKNLWISGSPGTFGFSLGIREVMDLASKPKEYAKKYLESRSTYILVKVIGGIMMD